MFFTNINGEKRLTLVKVSSLYDLYFGRNRMHVSVASRATETRSMGVSRHPTNLRL